MLNSEAEPVNPVQEPAAPAFQVGDLVRLKCGSPDMLVVEVLDPGVDLLYFAANGLTNTLLAHPVAAAALEKVEAKNKQKREVGFAFKR